MRRHVARGSRCALGARSRLRDDRSQLPNEYDDLARAVFNAVTVRRSAHEAAQLTVDLLASEWGVVEAKAEIARVEREWQKLIAIY